MDRQGRTLVLGVAAATVAAVLFVALIWPGPIGLPSAAESHALFDQRLVEQVYRQVSPAVVEVYSDRKEGDSFTEVTSGSGFLIDRAGYIVTNNHVIEKAERVRVSFIDHRDAPARVHSRNPANDLALLKVDPALVIDIDPVPLGDSSLVRPGQMVIIIGNPYGLKNSVSVGVASGIDRAMPSSLGRLVPGMLQTDALISPGSSGGPMLNSAGEAIGVTTAIELSSAQVNQRVGFAVPSKTLRELLPQLKKSGEVRPAWLGTRSQRVEPLLAERLGLPIDRGFYVVHVVEGSPAQRGGLVGSGLDSRGRAAAGGDIIVAVNGTPVQGGADLTRQLGRHRPGDVVKLTVLREESETTLAVTLGEWPGG
jgi:2-alkenal reductase